MFLLRFLACLGLTATAVAAEWRPEKHVEIISTVAAGGNQDIAARSVQRIWAAHGLKPHLTKTFKLSNDKQFVEKVKDVVGLYLDPPDKALVLSVDEKSQIQALDRTQPGLPLKRGRAATMTHDYKRYGTTTLFAALDVASGLIIGDVKPRHRAKEFLSFLRKIDRAVKKYLDVHLVLDNYAAHKTPEVKAWLAKHKRFHCHFTPTSASWLNLVERFFAEITGNRIRRGTFASVAELEALLFRRGAGSEMFELPAYQEVLFLYQLARDLHDRISAQFVPMVTADGTPLDHLFVHRV